MMQSKSNHVILLIIAFITWGSYVTVYDVNIFGNKKKQIYVILLCLYFIYVSLLFLDSENKNSTGILGFIAFIAILIHIVENSLNWISDAMISLDTDIQRISTNYYKDYMKQLNKEYVYNVPDVNIVTDITFMVYLDTINDIYGNSIPLLRLNNLDDALIKYNNEKNVFEIMQYGITNEPSIKEVPLKYEKWIQFYITIDEGTSDYPISLTLYIDNELVYNDKIYDITRINEFTIGYENNINIGFVKNIKHNLIDRY